MACRGVHFALEPNDVAKLRAAGGNDEVVDIVFEEFEAQWDGEWLCQTDKAWDAIHRCLTDGLLETDGEPYPLALSILGGEQLYQSDSPYSQEYFICLVDESQVSDVAEALGAITKEEFRKRYFDLDPEQYDGDIGEEDWEYTWNWFEPLATFFAKAAEAGRAVLFTVDQ